MEELERKYIELVLKKCLNFEQSKSLMIHYEFKEHLDFVLKIKEAAMKKEYRPLIVDGINKVLDGITNLDELNRKLRIY